MDSVTAGGGDTIRVLHVDDEPDLAELAATFLTKEDDRFSIETTTTASDGLDYLSANQVDCIISDYDMPGMDGIEFLEAVREAYPDLPFILYTGKGSEEVASDAISAGVTDYLQKEGGTDQYTILANRARNAVERYRAKRDADRTRTQLQAITDNSADAILMIDANSRIRFVNNAIEAHFGYTPAELHGEQLTTIMPERHREKHLAAIDQYLASGDRSLNWSQVEFPGLRKDGTEIPLSISFSEFEQDGDRRFIGIIRDVTEQREMEAQVRERKERLQQVAENIREVVWMTDPAKEEVCFVNAAFEEIWGRPVESLYDDPTSFLDSIHPDDRDHVQAAMEIQSSGEYDEEYRVVRPDGEIRWVHDRAVPVENNAGVVTRIVGTIDDITEHKRQEREREQIIERVTDAIVEVDSNWEFTLVNEQAECLYEMSEEHLLGRNFWDVFAAAEGTRFEDEYRQVMETREPTSFVEYFSQLDGWFDINVYPKADGGLAFYFIDVTDQRERERALEESEQRYRTLAESFPNGIVTLFDEDLCYNLAAGRAFESLPVAAADVENHSPRDVWGDAVADTLEPVMAATLDGQDRSVEIEYEDRHWAVHTVPITDDNGEVFAGMTMAQDITERTERQQEYERLLDLLNHTEQVADVGGWEIDPETEAVFWSEHLFEMLGWDGREEPPLDEALDVYVDADRPHVAGAVENAVSAGEAFDVEARYHRPDGEIRWFEIQGEPTSEAGEVVMLRGAVHDITDYKERERELTQAREEYETLFNGMNDAGWVLGLDGEIQAVNDAAVARTGYTRAELVGTRPHDITAGHDDEETTALIEEMPEDEVQVFETIRVTKEGEHIPIEISSSLITYRGETAVLSISRDISERQKREQQLERFASVVSHDLRNPLTVADGSLELAKEECESVHLDRIGQAHDRMHALIEDLLTLAREGDDVSDIEAVALPQLIKDCWGNVATADARLATELEGVIRADQSRLQQLVENLLRNAIEHGGEDVMVTVGALENGFYVEDDGPGIPEDDQEDIFEMGYSTREDGTGFGLSIAKQVAEAHGWEIRVTTGSDGDTRFEIIGVKSTDR